MVKKLYQRLSLEAAAKMGEEEFYAHKKRLRQE